MVVMRPGRMVYTEMKIAFLTSIFLGGCSLVLGTAPAYVPPGQWVPCTETRGPLVADATLAALSGVTAVSASEEHEKIGYAAANGILAAVFAYSVYYGWEETAHCRKVHAQYIQA